MWKRRKGVKISCALGIVRFVSRPGSCSSFARHLSCLLCRVVLVPPDISFACPASSTLPRGLYCLHVFPNTVSYHQSPSAPLVTYFVLLLSCLSKHICCGCWCCYKMCKLHNAAGGVVLELWCLVLRQKNMNFIACFCYRVCFGALCFGDSLQGYWSVRTVSENWHLSSEMQHVHLITTRAGFLPVTWHFPNKFVLFAEAHFPWDLQKASVSHDFLPSVPGLNWILIPWFHVNKQLLWIKILQSGIHLILLHLLNYARGRCQMTNSTPSW